MRRFPAFLLVGALLAAPALTAQSRPWTPPAIDSAQLLRDLSVLAHDSMEGRDAGTPGGARARRYLTERLRAMGYTPTEHAFSFTSRRASEPRDGRSLLVRVPGRSDTTRVLVVSAHYDHVGVRDGVVFNGTDDNASGTAALLAIAQSLRKSPPAHTVLLAFWDAEEQGLRGARAWVDAPTIPLERVAANINMDMVGRNVAGELYVAGGAKYPRFSPFLDSLAVGAPVILKRGHDAGSPSDDWTNQSDQGAFHAKGIPFLYFGVEDHPDYHKATDDFETIVPGFYVRAVQTVLEAVRRVDTRLATSAPPR
ncbi:MAG: M20/M25/M40 family metallo-hydrolase [Gemmatimonadaceae bacterium]|nr:M20/M25/M40 family metallo-hydrolase [Gemmatimonadaceae bacterium]